MNAQEGTSALGEGPCVSCMARDISEPSVRGPVGKEDVASEIVSEEVGKYLVELIEAWVAPKCVSGERRGWSDCIEGGAEGREAMLSR